VNFALSPWLNVADKCGSCKCVRDNVVIDMKQFRKRLNGEESDSTAGVLPPSYDEEIEDFSKEDGIKN